MKVYIAGPKKGLPLYNFPAVLIVALLIGCAATVPRDYVRPQYNAISQAELSATNTPSLYHAVERTKYLWLFGPRRVQSVFLDGQYLGDATWLNSISTNSVASVRWYSEAETTGYYGPRYRGPSLLVTSKR